MTLAPCNAHDHNGRDMGPHALLGGSSPAKEKCAWVLPCPPRPRDGCTPKDRRLAGQAAK